MVVFLCKKYDFRIENVHRHYDVCGKNCPLYYVNNETAWTQLKADISTALAPQVDKSKLHAIMGKSVLTKGQFLAWRAKQTAIPKLNCSFEQLVDLYYKIGDLEGVRADFALCQAIHETNIFQFENIVLPSQNNYCGFGATDSTPVGCATTFKTPEDGIIAHVQHLKAYACFDELFLNCKDSRFQYVQKGSAPYLEGLSIPNNPFGHGWASDVNYFDGIMRVYDGVANAVDKNRENVEKALNILVEKKVINSPDYWLENYDRLKWLDWFIIGYGEVLE